MRRQRSLRTVALGLALAFAATACGLEPVQPTPTPFPSAEARVSATPTAAPDRVPPVVMAQVPPPGGVMATTGRLRVVFSEPVTGIDEYGLHLHDAAGDVVAATVTLSPGGRIATLAPEAGLTVTATYTVMLTGGVRDLAGNALAPANWSLTASDRVSFAEGRYTGYRFGASSAHLTAVLRTTLDARSSAPASEYRVIDG